ncbi:hypothetical protein GYMLUDRAFT_651011 [Collybiopsis luxurians FD-317 M1]|uniref:Unplaced genomic scaffold GYMLUscaffold_30, whole genome shotgun sequence n=1 Tax=Collybiopsis luxurians FD-317 M1 TaxID=944289 RepID=A0A0D0CM50_9AGAR|nr:hypothetical protein GYMLUDRAFT_651011 [Collybiopsis luxurians FD-317 M1]
MDLDADLYGDLYETDIASPAAAEEKPSKQISDPLESTENTALSPVTTPTSNSTPTTFTSTVPSVQQIPTFEDLATRYRDEYSSIQQNGYDQNSEQHRSIRPSEMKEELLMLIVSFCAFTFVCLCTSTLNFYHLW